MKTYHIITYGCYMNVHESEKLAGMLESMGYLNTDDITQADVIVFNTCAIREGAENRAYGNIGALKPMLANSKKGVVVAVCGCMTQQEEVAKYIYNTFKFVNIVFGTHNLYEFSNYLKAYEQTAKRQLQIAQGDSSITENVPVFRTSGKNAWVNISYGCNNFCAFCIVPYVRGREKSRKKEDILKEIENLAKTGEYELITLLGQNVNSYGNDINNGYGFKELLQDIVQIEGNFKVTFMSSHPKDFSFELIDIIANNDKILKEVHLPCQSGSNAILKRMNRNYTVEKYESIIQTIKQKIPSCRITSDFIVGFPGETEDDFNQTKNLLKRVKYDSIFAFIYSVRTGTVAASMPNQIPEDIKNRRVNELLALEKEIQANKA